MIGFGFGFWQSRGGSSSLSLSEQLVASSATLAAYDYTDTSTMTASGGGSVTTGSAVANVPNVKNPGTYDVQQDTSAFEPTYNAGLLHDGVDDFWSVPLPATPPTNATLVYVVKTSGTSFMLAGSPSSGVFAGVAVDASGVSAESGFTGVSYHADGSLISPDTRDDLHAAWATGTAVVARISGLDLTTSSITEIRNRWAGSGFFVDGRAMLIAILDADDADYANALALAEQEAARQITELGL